MTSEAGISLAKCVKHLALTLRFAKPNHEIRLIFCKVWANPPTERSKKKEQVAHLVMMSFQQTQGRLHEVLKAAWSDKTSNSGPLKRREKDTPDYLKSIKTFVHQGRNLTELLIAAIVLVDYCLDVTLKKEGDRLIDIIRDLFCKERSFHACWKLLNWLLQIKVSKKTKILEQLFNKPITGKTVLQDSVSTTFPESVRDWAVELIHENKKKAGDFFSQVPSPTKMLRLGHSTS